MHPTRRHLLQGAAAALLPPGMPRAAADEPKLIHEPRHIHDDYALARQRFRTHLVKMGPAPDEPQPLSAPPGARRLEYRSGELTLAAWISENADTAPSTGSRLTGSRPAVLFLHGGNALWQDHWALPAPMSRRAMSQ